MKGIVIASNASGGGKTTVTLGLMQLLKNKGYEVQGYKVGPDYIDPAFHSEVTGKASRNLDIHLMGEEGIKASFSRGKGDYAVVEGVMGLYDGKGIDEKYSTYHVARELDLPIVLVLSPKASVATLCAEINGLRDFRNANIRGIILNNISSSYYELLKLAIEKNCNMKVLGYLQKNEELSLESRHLGLVQSMEVANLRGKIELCAELLEKSLNVDMLLDIFEPCKKYEDNYHLTNRNLKVAIARDKAFSFYYKENLELLEESCEVHYFSPLEDKKLPEDVEFIYLGGGYPEVFEKELLNNASMRKSIKVALESGVRCYAECGGLMYLTKGILKENLDLQDELANSCKENVHSYVGFLNGYSIMSKKLQRFGYAQVEIAKDNPLLQKETKINCHEFHKSYVDLKEEMIYKVSKEMFNGNIREWNCGYMKNNTLGAYAHVHFFGNLKFIDELLK